MKTKLLKLLILQGIFLASLTADIISFIKPQSKMQNLQVGESISAGNINVTLNNFRVSRGTKTEPVSPDMIYHIFDFSISNGTKESIYIYEKADFILKDNQGHYYNNCDAHFLTGNFLTKIFVSDMNRGELAYLAPKTVTNLKILFDFSGFGFDAFVSWKADYYKGQIAPLDVGRERAPKSAYKELFYIKNKLSKAITYKENSLTPYVIYSSNKTILEKGTLLNNFPINKWQRYYPDDSIFVTGTIKNGNLNKGFVNKYYISNNQTNNIEISAKCNKGLIKGAVTFYYPNGTIKAVIQTKNNLKNGKATFYSLSSNVTIEASYTENRLDGTIIVYNKEGNSQKEILLEKETVIEAYSFDSAGTKSTIKGFVLKNDETYKYISLFTY